MRARLSIIAEHLHGSYWFVPTLMTAGAVLLSVLTLTVDAAMSGADQPAWLQVALYSGGADGARSMLSAIAGSMITVAGVVFSITIVALTLASNQFGPRLLSNFMSDRGNQVTLGTFLAAFVYSLLVLRKIRSGESEQVPHLSVAIALLLAIAGISVLIYYIHHIAAKIQAPNLVASIGGDLRGYVDRLFPHAEGLEKGRAGLQSPPLPDRFDGQAREVSAPSSGYVDVVDLDGLLSFAREQDLLIRVDTRPGRFVVRGSPIGAVWPPERVDDRVLARVAGAVVTGPRRTAIQDFQFPVQQLVEIAVRSLSPGINDPYTANSCIEWLGAALCEVVEASSASSHLLDADGDLRVVVTAPVRFDELVGDAFDEIRACADFHTVVHVTLLGALTDIAGHTVDSARLDPLVRQARLVVEAAEQGVKQAADLAVVRRRYDALLAVAARAGARV